MAQILYVIGNRKQLSEHGCAMSLKKACERKGLEYIQLIADELALDELQSLPLVSGSLLYRVSTHPKAQIVESSLVLTNPAQLTTIYTPKTTPISNRPFTELNEQLAAGLRVIPTRIIDETWRGLDAASLDAKVHGLGGFPVVIKRLGKAHGVGVQKVDDLQTLQHILQTETLENYDLIARKYLHDYRHYRLIVVDGAVIAAIEYHKPDDDFRTNAVAEPNVSKIELSELDESIVRMGIDSVALRCSLLGGVDVLIDQSDGVAYLAEVNVPCYFARAEGPTGVDVGGAIIDAMIRRSNGSV